MPGITAHMHFPYPVNTDPIDVAGDIKKLADAVDGPVFTNQSKIASFFPQYNTVAALRADTTSDFAQLLVSGNGFVPCWRESASSGASWLYAHDFTGTRNTDGSGEVAFNATELGFATVLYAIATVAWSITMDATTAQIATARISTNTVQTRIFWLNVGGQIGFLANKSVTVTIHCMGRA